MSGWSKDSLVFILTDACFIWWLYSEHKNVCLPQQQLNNTISIRNILKLYFEAIFAF